jgi:hypothetical protein
VVCPSRRATRLQGIQTHDVRGSESSSAHYPQPPSTSRLPATTEDRNAHETRGLSQVGCAFRRLNIEPRSEAVKKGKKRRSKAVTLDQWAALSLLPIGCFLIYGGKVATYEDIRYKGIPESMLWLIRVISVIAGLFSIFASLRFLLSSQ